MADLLEDDPFDYLVLPDEPLTNGWSYKWDDESLDYRFGRFGLELKRGPQGIAIVHSLTGHYLRVPDLDYEGIDRPFSEICEVLHDMESAETLERSRHSDEAPGVLN